MDFTRYMYILFTIVLLSFGMMNPFLSIASYSLGLERVLTVFLSAAFEKIIIEYRFRIRWPFKLEFSI